MLGGCRNDNITRSALYVAMVLHVQVNKNILSEKVGGTKPMSHQLSQRECFYLLFLTPKSLLHRRFPPVHLTDLIQSRRIVKIF